MLVFYYFPKLKSTTKHLEKIQSVVDGLDCIECLCETISPGLMFKLDNLNSYIFE